MTKTNNNKKNKNNARAQPKKQQQRQSNTISKAPLAINNRSRNVAPQIKQSGLGTAVSHREILSENAVASVAFSVAGTIAVQPALSSYSHGSPLGTWLPKIAAEYDNYVFEKLKVHFITSASSLQRGTIFMAYDPNPESSAPTSFSDLRNMAHAVTGPARENLVLDVSSVVRQRKLLTRSRAVTSYPPYDAGRLFIGSTLGDDVSVGYFEVEYTVRLSNPQTSPSTETFASTIAPPALMYSDYGLSSTVYYFGTTHASRNAFGWNRYLVAGGPYFGDTTLLTHSLLNTSSIGSIVRNGVTYSWASGVPTCTWKPRLPGRYRVSGVLNPDASDFATFGASVVRTTQAGAATPLEATDIAISTAGEQQLVPLIPISFRGFSNPTVSGDDTGCNFDQTFAVRATDEWYSFMVGVRNNTAISENATAICTFDMALFGANFIKFEYIGPLPA